MNITLNDFEQLERSGGSDGLRASLLLWKFNRPTYGRWTELVEQALVYEMQQISQRAHNFQDAGEDAITATLVIALRSLGLNADSAVVNGNTDVSIRYTDDYIWLGEAKIFTGVSVIWGGYLQLTKRYSVALPSQDRGGMLLYCFKDSASALLSEWRAALAAQVPHSNVRDGDMPLMFRSEDVSPSSGITLNLAHLAFPLLYKPEDDAKLSPAAFEAGKKAKREA